MAPPACWVKKRSAARGIRLESVHDGVDEARGVADDEASLEVLAVVPRVGLVPAALDRDVVLRLDRVLDRLAELAQWREHALGIGGRPGIGRLDRERAGLAAHG